MLWNLPRLKVLALRGDASNAFLMKLTLRTEVLGELSPKELVEVVRAAALDPLGIEAAR